MNKMTMAALAMMLAPMGSAFELPQTPDPRGLIDDELPTVPYPEIPVDLRFVRHAVEDIQEDLGEEPSEPTNECPNYGIEQNINSNKCTNDVSSNNYYIQHCDQTSGAGAGAGAGGPGSNSASAQGTAGTNCNNGPGSGN